MVLRAILSEGGDLQLSLLTDGSADDEAGASPRCAPNIPRVPRACAAAGGGRLAREHACRSRPARAGRRARAASQARARASVPGPPRSLSPRVSRARPPTGTTGRVLKRRPWAIGRTRRAAVQVISLGGSTVGALHDMLRSFYCPILLQQTEASGTSLPPKMQAMLSDLSRSLGHTVRDGGGENGDAGGGAESLEQFGGIQTPEDEFAFWSNCFGKGVDGDLVRAVNDAFSAISEGSAAGSSATTGRSSTSSSRRHTTRCTRRGARAARARRGVPAGAWRTSSA